MTGAGTEGDIGRHKPRSNASEVAYYTVIIAACFGCLGTAGMGWAFAAGLCDLLDVALMGVTGAAIAAVITGVWLVMDRNRLLWAMEGVLGKDINRDGTIGKPRGDKSFAWVHPTKRMADQVAVDDLRFWLRHFYGVEKPQRRTFAEWDDVIMPSGMKMDQPLWEEYNQDMIEAGLASRKGRTTTLDPGDTTYRHAMRVFRELLD